MPKQRQYAGDETLETLSKWKKDQKTAERLAGSVLLLDNFTEIDPSHPLGGRDGAKDLLCRKGERKFIVGVYFPRTQQSFTAILKKVQQDYAGVAKNDVDRLIFFTNQHLTVGERDRIKNVDNKISIEIYHLERIGSILNSPVGYGVRLEFLDIELSKAEQLSYFAHKDKEVKEIRHKLSELLKALNETGGFSNISTEKFSDFKTTLEAIVGDKNSLYVYGNSMIDRLHVPLKELKEFQEILGNLTDAQGEWYLGNYYHLARMEKLNVPLKDLEEFRDLLYEIIGEDNLFTVNDVPINKLSVPLKELEQYNYCLDEIVEKLKEIEKIKRKAIDTTR